MYKAHVEVKKARYQREKLVYFILRGKEVFVAFRWELQVVMYAWIYVKQNWHLLYTACTISGTKHLHVTVHTQKRQGKR